MQKILTWKGISKACAVTAGREQNSFLFWFNNFRFIKIYLRVFSVFKMLKFMISEIPS